MRKVVPIALLLLIIAAAGTPADAAEFGIKGGVNIANIYGEDPGDETDSKTGFAGGIFVDWGITPLFGIQPELLYVQNGSRSDFFGGDLFLKFNYLQVPVLAKVDLPVGGSLIPVLYAGGYASLLLDSKLVAEVEGEGGTLGLKDYTKSYDAGLVFGVALDFSAGTGTMTIEGRYNLGMVEIDDGIGGGIFGVEDAEGTDMKNESLMIMVGYTF